MLELAVNAVVMEIPSRQVQNEALSRECTDNHVKALARKYGVSEVWIYAIIRRQRSLKQQKGKTE